MVKDGYQTVWGVRKCSEWVLELSSEKKRRRYSRYLTSMWAQKSQGILTEINGQPTPIPKLKETMKETFDTLWGLVEKLLGTMPSLKDSKDQKGAFEQAKTINELVLDIAKCVAQKEGKFQIAAVHPISPNAPPAYGDVASTAQQNASAPPSAEPATRAYQRPVPHPRSRYRLSQSGPMAPTTLPSQRRNLPQMAPITFLNHAELEALEDVDELPVTYAGPTPGAGEEGHHGYPSLLRASDLNGILQSLPPLRSQDPNVDFWVKLKDCVVGFSLNCNDVITVIKHKAPLGYATRMAEASWPAYVPGDQLAWEVFLTECQKLTQDILGRGHQTYSSVANCIQGPAEPFSAWISRFTDAHRTLSACVPNTPALDTQFMIESAANNLNATYKQMWAMGLPQIETWSQFLTWGQRAETTQAQLGSSNSHKIAAISDDTRASPAKEGGRQGQGGNQPENCYRCGTRGHRTRDCKRSRNRRSNNEEREEILALLRSLSKANLNSDQ